MKSDHFLETLGSQPNNVELARTARELVESGEYEGAEDALASALMLEKKIELAFNIKPPEQLSERLLVLSGQARWHSRWQTLRRKTFLRAAASLAAFGIFAGTWFWLNNGLIENKLAADCVAHLSHEPFSLNRKTRVPPALVSQLFAKHGLKIKHDLVVNYLQPCVIDGRSALHLVLQQSDGPVTVMIFTMSKPINDIERSLDSAKVRVRGFDSGGLVFVAESSRDFDNVEAMMRAALEGQRIRSTG